MTIENYYLQTTNREIFCTLIRPQNISSDCIIYFSPIFEERIWAQRIALNFAKQIAEEKQISVLMFDYFGYGESDGLSEEFTLADCLNDLNFILEDLSSKGYFSYFFWGVRSGSAILHQAVEANLDASITRIVHWAPIFNLAQFIENGLRGSVAGQYMLFKKTVVKRDEIIKEMLDSGKCERNGYVLNIIESFRIGKKFFQEAIELRDKSNPPKSKIPTLIANVYKSESALDSKTKETGSPGLNDQYLTHAHVVENEFWKIGTTYSQRAENLYRVTSNWIDQ